MTRFILLLCLICSSSLQSQNLLFLSEQYTWPDFNKNFDAIPDSFKNDDAVILSDDINLNFPEHFIKRRQSVKILNNKGLNYYKTTTLPQNFDITTQNNPTYKQGRFCKRLIPFIYEYKIVYFAVRIIRNKTIIELPLKVSTNKVYWVKNDGERLYDYEYIFDFEDLQVDDVIEYSYKAEIKGSYDTDQFYINDYYPKLKTNLLVRVITPMSLAATDIIMNHNIDSSLFTKTIVPDKKNTYLTYTYAFKHTNAVKYAQNILAGKTLPHVTANVYSVNKNFYNQSLQSINYLYTVKYSWFVIPDSLNEKVKVYDKYGAGLRKFIAKFPENTKDSSKNLFYAQIIDTINTYKFISAEQMHYSKDAQYALTASEKLIKRELVEEFIGNTYSDILFEKNIFYYIANVQDRRLGFHSTSSRSHEDYELEFIALPVKTSFKFYIPRFNGIKYLPDELPFYYEGTYCALFPKNTKAATYKNGLQDLKFIKTPMSTFNENVRSENAVFKVNIDSSIIHTSIKVNLNGQFSTILRHYYNNDAIDSTIKQEYFKKCIDKPNASDQQVKLVSQTKSFPFKTTYTCSENIKTSKETIDLSGWFSFLFLKENFQKAITQDYYLDFTFTDTYNFMFEFNKPITISNMNEFNKTLNNEFFEVKSLLTKQEDNKYVLTVTTKAKQYLIPKTKTNYLIEYIYLLDQINTLKLEYTN